LAGGRKRLNGRHIGGFLSVNGPQLTGELHPVLARHSNPWTGGEFQLRFAAGAGLGEAAATFWVATCFDAALLEGGTALLGGAATGRFVVCS